VRPFLCTLLLVLHRRRLAYLAASVVAAAGMMTGHALGQAAHAAGTSAAAAAAIGIGAWVAAGIAAVLIDRTVPARAVAVASIALPLVWFGTMIVSEERELWWVGLALLVLFAAVAGLAAAAAGFFFRRAAGRA